MWTFHDCLCDENLSTYHSVWDTWTFQFTFVELSVFIHVITMVVLPELFPPGVHNELLETDDTELSLCVLNSDLRAQS